MSSTNSGSAAVLEDIAAFCHYLRAECGLADNTIAAYRRDLARFARWFSELRATELKEDASLATFYLVSLALGVTIVSVKGTNIDLLHVLFGNILAMDNQTLLVIAFNATVTLLVLAVIYRPLVIECVDPVFLRTVSRAGAPAHLAFLALVVVNLVSGFHALGTLLGVGLMILPAGIARFWSRDITGMICIAVLSAIVSGYAGLVLSFQSGIPSGPAIILVAAVFYVTSLLFGSCGGLVRQAFPGRHLEA